MSTTDSVRFPSPGRGECGGRGDRGEGSGGGAPGEGSEDPQPRSPSRGPGPEEVVAADGPERVQDLAAEEQAGVAAALQGARIDLRERHAAARDLGLAVALVARPGQEMIGERLD